LHHDSPDGTAWIIRFGVMVPDQDPAILCGLRRALDYPGGSDSGNITLQEY